MSRSKTSKAWMREHVNDPYVQKAKAEGYRSRAAYKLLELDKKDRLLAPGQLVVVLGAAPGSWSQVAAAKLGPRGRVVAVDLLPMEPLPGVRFIQGDFREQALRVERARADDHQGPGLAREAGEGERIRGAGQLRVAAPRVRRGKRIAVHESK